MKSLIGQGFTHFLTGMADGFDTFAAESLLELKGQNPLARNLLTYDGVIFISIDDDEVANLKKLCDEVFGEENFVDILMVELSNMGGMKVGAAKTGTIVKNGEFILLYGQSELTKKKDRVALFDYIYGFDTHFNLFMTEVEELKIWVKYWLRTKK